MTNVLHIFQKDDSMIANYVTMLNKYLEGHVESHSADNVDEAKRIVAQWQPDIIHQHGMVRWATQLNTGNARKILTPHGQTNDGCGAYVVVARSEMEAGMIVDSPRLEIVRNPLVTKSVRAEDTASQLLRIYQKVMDSDVLPFMSDDTRSALRLLLKVALCGDARWADGRSLPPSLQYRLLYIYTYHEGVNALLDRGLTLLGQQIPPHTIPVSYLPEGYVRPKPRTKASVTELTAEVQQQLHQGRLELLLLCDLFLALRSPSLNEERLLAEIEDEKLITLFPCLLQLLKEELLLDEGYMPCPPTNNRTTEALRTSLYHHLTL